MRVLSDEECLKILLYYLHFYNITYLLDLIIQKYYNCILNTFGRKLIDIS